MTEQMEKNEFEFEIENLLKNIENIKADIDMYGVLVDEKLLQTV